MSTAGKLVFVLLAMAWSWVSPAHAALINATFQGTLSTFAGGDGRVRTGDPFAGVLTMDPSYDYGYRIDHDRARFIWSAWDSYSGPPPVPPPPLPVYIGFENLRTGEHFDVPAFGAAYDYSAAIPPYSTIDFATENNGQQLELGSFLQFRPAPNAVYWTIAILTLAGAQDALFDGFDVGVITPGQGSVIPALSSARYATDAIEFTLALRDFGPAPAAAVPEPGGVGLVALGLLALGAVKRARATGCPTPREADATGCASPRRTWR